MTEPRPFHWGIIRGPYAPGWYDPFSVAPFYPSRRRPFSEMERLLYHLPHLLDEDKVRNAFGDGEAAGTSMDVERSDPNNFTCSFNLHGFKPDHVKIKTIGNKVVVDAEMEDHHEDEDHQSYSRRQFHRSIVLPENVNADQLTSTLNEQGVLNLKAPLLALPPPKEKPKEVPITVEKMEAVQES